MLVASSPIFVADTKITLGCNFGALLTGCLIISLSLILFKKKQKKKKFIVLIKNT